MKINICTLTFQAEARKAEMRAAGRELEAANMLDEGDDDLLF